MSERYIKYWDECVCEECGVVVPYPDKHDAFHDRIDRLAAVLLQRDREEMEASEPEPLLCAVCGEPVDRYAMSTGNRIVHQDQIIGGRRYGHAATLTPPEPPVGAPHWWNDEWWLSHEGWLGEPRRWYPAASDGEHPRMVGRHVPLP